MSKHIVNSRWGRDRVASDILTPFPEIYSAHKMLYLLLCVARFWSESQSISSVVRLSVSGVWGEWVPLSTVCPRQKRGFVPHHKSTTAWNAVRQCASRRPWLDEPGPPPSLELKIAGFELKLADKQRGHELKQAAQSSSWRSLLQWISRKTNMIVSNKTFARTTIVDYNHGFWGDVI